MIANNVQFGHTRGMLADLEALTEIYGRFISNYFVNA